MATSIRILKKEMKWTKKAHWENESWQRRRGKKREEKKRKGGGLMFILWLCSQIQCSVPQPCLAVNLCFRVWEFALYTWHLLTVIMHFPQLICYGLESTLSIHSLVLLSWYTLFTFCFPNSWTTDVSTILNNDSCQSHSLLSLALFLYGFGTYFINSSWSYVFTFLTKSHKRWDHLQL